MIPPVSQSERWTSNRAQAESV